MDSLKNKRVADLGCGNGRWSYFIKDKCRELVLVDFSDAIFVARKNLSDAKNCLFFMCDIKALPFKERFCDFIFTLGVLHHLPTNCLDEVRALKRYAPQILVFLYYALDNRPFYFRFILKAVTLFRAFLSKIKNELFRKLISVLGTIFVYEPLILLGGAFEIFGLGKYIPLYDFYKKKTFVRIEQDVYDRFFTRIEQRVTRREILQLRDTFSDVKVSDNLPYWHFLCSGD
jgi:SAM-dependent methyltransferase